MAYLIFLQIIIIQDDVRLKARGLENAGCMVGDTDDF